jgi:hypothetical protein
VVGGHSGHRSIIVTRILFGLRRSESSNKTGPSLSYTGVPAKAGTHLPEARTAER